MTVSESFDQAVAHHRAGRLAQAEAGYRAVLEADPDHAGAWHMTGVLDLQRGNLDRAAERIRRSIALDDRDGRAFNNLGNALRALDRPADAMAAFRAALQRDPGLHDARTNLGVCLLEAGRPDQAIQLWQAVVEAQPDHVLALGNLGAALHGRGDLDGAHRHLRRARDLAPESLEVLNNLAAVLIDLTRFDQAAACLAEAEKRAPDHPTTLFNRAVLLDRSGRLVEAVQAYRAVLKRAPRIEGAWLNLGDVLTILGRHAEALETFDRALDMFPGDPRLLANRAVTLEQAGRLADALADYDRAIAADPRYLNARFRKARLLEQLNRLDEARRTALAGCVLAPDNPGVNLILARWERRQGRAERTLARLEALGHRPMNADVAAGWQFERGQVLDGLEQVDAAFAAFAEGNRIAATRPRARAVDPAYFPDRLARLQETFTRSWVESWRPLDLPAPAPRPVFLVGFPRSGTTLLGRLLGRHPDIRLLDETGTVTAVEAALARDHGGDPQGLATLDRDAALALRDRYYQVAGAGDGPVLMDKNPLNLASAGLIHRLFPTARFLFVARHPCDAVLSCFMQDFAANVAMVHFASLADGARLYGAVMDLWRHYRDLLPLDVHTIWYEDLVMAPEATLADIFTGLGLDPAPAAGAGGPAVAPGEMVATPSYQQVSRGVYREAKGRWLRYRDHLEPVLGDLAPYAAWLGYDL